MSYQILDAVEIKPWIRVAVVVLNDGINARVVSTLWQTLGGMYHAVPGVRKPKKVSFSTYAFRILWLPEDQMYEARAVTSRGEETLAKGVCEKDVAKEAWSRSMSLK